MEAAGLAVEARLERTSYPGEVDTRRAYLLGRRGAQQCPPGDATRW